MRNMFVFFCLILLSGCSPTTYYIVRHAEKEGAGKGAATLMSSDVPLSETGLLRAQALKDLLQAKKVKHIFSTNFKRTLATAQPLSNSIGIPVERYGAVDSLFLTTLRSKNLNVLIVGHSNTVDELVNGLTGQNQLQNLPETQYGDLFIVTRQRGKYTFSKSKFGL